MLRKGPVAQSVEQRIENPCVGGSIPSQATRFKASVLQSSEAFLHLRPTSLRKLRDELGAPARVEIETEKYAYNDGFSEHMR